MIQSTIKGLYNHLVNRVKSMRKKIVPDALKPEHIHTIHLSHSQLRDAMFMMACHLDTVNTIPQRFHTIYNLLEKHYEDKV